MVDDDDVVELQSVLATPTLMELILHSSSTSSFTCLFFTLFFRVTGPF